MKKYSSYASVVMATAQGQKIVRRRKALCADVVRIRKCALMSLFMFEWTYFTKRFICRTRLSNS